MRPQRLGKTSQLILVKFLWLSQNILLNFKSKIVRNFNAKFYFHPNLLFVQKCQPPNKKVMEGKKNFLGSKLFLFVLFKTILTYVISFQIFVEEMNYLHRGQVL